MLECPKCNSTAEPTLIDTLWSENGWSVYRINKYRCNCGQCFEAVAVFECRDAYEEVITEGE